MKTVLVLALISLLTTAFCGDCSSGGGGFGPPVQRNPFKQLNERIVELKEAVNNAKDEKTKAVLELKLKMAIEEKDKAVERARTPYEKRISDLQARYNKEMEKLQEDIAQIDKWSGKESAVK